MGVFEAFVCSDAVKDFIFYKTFLLFCPQPENKVDFLVYGFFWTTVSRGR